SFLTSLFNYVSDFSDHYDHDGIGENANPENCGFDNLQCLKEDMHEMHKNYNNRG
nr:hypothetical protein [Tanacetum cinerariifolium]